MSAYSLIRNPFAAVFITLRRFWIPDSNGNSSIPLDFSATARSSYLSFLLKLHLVLWDSLLVFMCECVHAQSLSHVQLFVTPWTVACQGPLSVGFPRQEYWAAISSSRVSFLLRNWTCVFWISCIGDYSLPYLTETSQHACVFSPGIFGGICLTRG